jgi:hypothetical protein
MEDYCEYWKAKVPDSAIHYFECSGYQSAILLSNLEQSAILLSNSEPSEQTSAQDFDQR